MMMLAVQSTDPTMPGLPFVLLVLAVFVSCVIYGVVRHRGE